MSDRVLLVEDDATLATIVSETLERDGFNVIRAVDGEDGLLKYVKYGADVIVADVMMPRMDGFEMGRRLRQVNRDVPLLYLTAKSDIDDIVEGFELGGNDYLNKPFKMLELIVRIKALLRRNIMEEAVSLSLGRYTLDMSTQMLECRGDESIKLTLIEAKLLKELMNNVGRTVDGDVLMLLVWQRDDPYSRNSLHGFIHKLRYYLRHDPSISIINQKGIGYMLTRREG